MFFLSQTFSSKNSSILSSKVTKQFLNKFKEKQKLYRLFMYIKGYNYKARLIFFGRILKLDLGYPLPLYISIPYNIRVFKLKRRYFSFYSTDWDIIYRFCWYLRNLKSHFPYKRRGFILAREKPLRKVGKKSRK